MNRSERKGAFKTRGAGILNQNKMRPKNIREFLDDSIEQNTAENSSAALIQNNKCAFTQNPINTNAKKPIFTDRIERLHVHIRKDLSDKLLETVYKLKQDQKIKKHDATQRIIIEKALEKYFEKHNCK